MSQGYLSTDTEADRASINNAYVSGMKEDAGLGGTDINMLSTVLTSKCL